MMPSKYVPQTRRVGAGHTVFGVDPVGFRFSVAVCVASFRLSSELFDIF